jgi:cytidylate kinase
VIVAIDGPAAAGKGTLARRLAKHLGLRYLDTGLLYRAVAARILDQGAAPGDEVVAEAEAKALMPNDLSRTDLRGEAVGAAASVVAAQPAVRRALLAFQRDFAAKPPGAVLDGRDIGTVVCPEADIKLFIHASLAVRARRRMRELQEKGESPIHARVLRDMAERDARDSARAVAALKPAPDAIDVDTSDLNADQAFERALEVIRGRMRTPG